VFTLLTLLTCYQIASSRRGCVRLQCWVKERTFPRLEALDNVVVGQPFLLNFRLFVEDVRYISMFPALPPALTPVIQHLNPMCSLKYFSVLFFPIPRTAALSCRSPSASNHPVRAALLSTSMQDSVLSCG